MQFLLLVCPTRRMTSPTSHMKMLTTLYEIAAVCTSHRLIVAGTSCAVFSAFRLVRQALKQNAEVIVITRGPTRADELIRPDLRFVDAATDVLEEILT